MSTGLLKYFIRHVTVRDKSNRFGPSQGCPLPIGEKWSFAPGVERIQPLLALSFGPRVFGVHVDTVSAPVNLRCSHPDQLQQWSLQLRRFPDEHFKCQHGM